MGDMASTLGKQSVLSLLRPAGALGCVAAAALWACGGGGAAGQGTAGPSVFDASVPDSGPQKGPPSLQDGGIVVGTAGDGGGTADAHAGQGATVSNVTIVPAGATLSVVAGSSASLPFKVMGVLNGSPPAVDVTSRFVFYVPDNYLVGGFPTTGAPTFTSRVPLLASDPPQRGGVLTVQATAENPGGKTIVQTTSLTVQLEASLGAGQLADAGVQDSGLTIPADAGALFGGAADPSRAPVLEYPNDGTMLPPNLQLLDVHWLPGKSNTLFEISFSSKTAHITYYSRCGDLGGLIPTSGCGFQLDPTGYAYLAQSNAGSGKVALTIRGTDEHGTGVGSSSTFSLEFASESVNGGVYYWDVTHTRIMRFDFGGTSSTPEVFLAPGQYGTDSKTCIGCHSISPDGTKMAASSGGQGGGYLDYIGNVASLTTPLTRADDGVNRMQFATWAPSGSLFASVFGDGAPSSNTSLNPNNLWFHDGNTGVILPSLTRALSFEPDHPAWSPDGTMIAMTHVGAHNTSQREYLGGIDVATFLAGAVSDAGINLGDSGSMLQDPVVVIPSNVTTGGVAVNSYNPSFAPDSTFLLYSQTTCPVAEAQTESCDSDVSKNTSATTWAVKPAAGATPIHLDHAAAPGVADGPNAAVVDTFPRSTPFETKQGAGKLFWFTVASQRNPGLRARPNGTTQQQLWMFAVDPAKILAGTDGSYTAFFLPFQDPTTSNHIAEWTQKIVTAVPPPVPPSPPPPPPPPAPPAPQ